MKQIKNEVPNLVLYTPDRRKIIGQLNAVNNLKEQIRFGSVSEMTFKIPQKIYDVQECKWIDNANYDEIEENSILYFDDENDYFKFDGREINETDYKLDTSGKSGRPNNLLSLDLNSYLSNFKIQNETELFDIGSESGYYWRWFCYIDDNGAILDKSNNKSDVWDGYAVYKHYACEDFIPVEMGDIIAMFSVTEDNQFSYRIHYYREADSKTYLGIQEGMEEHYAKYSPIGRVEVKFPYDEIANEQPTKGYIRIEMQCENAEETGSGYHSSYPTSGWVKVYSGQRYCSSFTSSNRKTFTCGLMWWVVTSVEEINEGTIPYKNITAYSYEYILSKKTFSLTKGTLPLYIPDTIPNVVKGDTWLRDCVGESGSALIEYKSPQRMDRGLLNQILDYLPSWKIGYVDTNICTKYRTFDDLDNVNLYSFISNDLQSAYQCYFVFDSNKRLIHIISGTVQEEALKGIISGEVGMQSFAYLSWDNAIKKTNIHTTDSRCVTALRVHSSDDKYGLGLINPTGNNILYNFDSYAKYMDFVADTDKGRTLWEAVENYQNNISNSRDNYINCAKTLVSANLESIKLQAKVSEALTKYRSVADKINVYLAGDYPNTFPNGVKYITDYPLSETALMNPPYAPLPNYSNYHSKKLYDELCQVSRTYNGVRKSYDESVKKYNDNFAVMKEISAKLSLNYKAVKDKEDKGISTAVLSSKEIMALSEFIIEGDWTNENVVFSDTYTSNDILTTLNSLYDEAEADLNSYISKHCYEFEIESVNILKIDEFNIDDLYLGYSIILETKSGICQCPVCLCMQINYDDDLDFSLTFNTDYNTKPLQVKFSKLFGTINQTSVIDTNWNFSE